MPIFCAEFATIRPYLLLESQRFQQQLSKAKNRFPVNEIFQKLQVIPLEIILRLCFRSNPVLTSLAFMYSTQALSARSAIMNSVPILLVKVAYYASSTALFLAKSILFVQNYALCKTWQIFCAVGQFFDPICCAHLFYCMVLPMLFYVHHLQSRAVTCTDISNLRPFLVSLPGSRQRTSIVSQLQLALTALSVSVALSCTDED